MKNLNFCENSKYIYFFFWGGGGGGSRGGVRVDAELILGFFQSGPTPPSDSQKGAKV